MVRTITILTAALLAMSSAAAFAQSGQAGVQTGTSAQESSQSGGASAQTSANANASAEPEGSLAAGTALNAQLDQTVDSKKAKAGDSISAKTADSVKANGKTVLPKGTKLVGHVTKATARGKGDADSVLAVQFDRAILKGGREVPLQASVQALAAAQSVTAATVSGDDLQPMTPSGGGGMNQGTGRPGGAGTGVTSAAGAAASGAASTIPRTTTEATGAVNSTVNGAAGASRAGTGLGAGGQLVSTSRGVFGLEGLALNANANNSAEGSVITSTGKNVHLDSGTRILLVTQSATSVAAQR